MSATKLKTVESLKFDGLSFGYEVGEDLFREVEFDFPTGCVSCISGFSGTGKSSLLRIMAGLQVPNNGRYLINDEEVNEMSFEDFLPYRLNIGYSFEMGGLLSNKTIHQNLALPLMYHKLVSEDETHLIVEELLEAFDLKSVSHLRPSAISGGKRKATTVARSFVMNPELLILDNPTTGLNKDVTQSLVLLLEKKINSGELKHVFVASDHVAFLESVATKKIHISGRKLSLHDCEWEKEDLFMKLKKASGQ